MKTAIAILTLSSSFLFYSCNPDPLIEEVKSPYPYYPLELGKYIVYSVDSIQYHETIPHDTSQYEVKELLVDTFYDNEDNLNYKIERYIRQEGTVDWILDNVWSVIAIDNQIQKIEDNLRFIKLVAPVADNLTWEGNIFLGGLEDLPYDEECNILTFLEGWVYEYDRIDQPYSINGFDFDKTIKVLQAGDSNLIWYDYAEEIYALGVGMVQKDFYHYYTQDTSCPTCAWEERVQCGYSVKMKVIEYN